MSNNVWLTVILMGVGSMAMKAAGPVVVGGRALPPRAMGLVSMLAPALLAALAVTNVFGGDRELVLDARVVGFGAAAILVALRTPVLAVVIGATLVTALARAAG